MFQFLGRPKTSGAVVTAVFYVVVLRQRGDHGGTALYLADAVQDDFGTALVRFYGSTDFDGAPGKTADVPDILQVVGEDYDREGTGHSIFTEVQEVNALVPDVSPMCWPASCIGMQSAADAEQGTSRTARSARKSPALANNRGRAAEPCPAGQAKAPVPTRVLTAAFQTSMR